MEPFDNGPGVEDFIGCRERGEVDERGSLAKPGAAQKFRQVLQSARDRYGLNTWILRQVSPPVHRLVRVLWPFCRSVRITHREYQCMVDAIIATYSVEASLALVRERCKNQKGQCITRNPLAFARKISRAAARAHRAAFHFVVRSGTANPQPYHAECHGEPPCCHRLRQAILCRNNLCKLERQSGASACRRGHAARTHRDR